MINLKVAIIEGLKELLRTVVLAVIPVVVTSINTTTGEIKLNLAVLLTVGLVAALSGLDRLLHKWGKETNNESMEKGLTRF